MLHFKNNMKIILLFTAAAALILFFAFSGISPGAIKIRGTPTSVSHAVLRSACSSTQHADLCFSMVSAATSYGRELTSQKDVIAALLDATTEAAIRTYIQVKTVSDARIGLPATTESAVNTCLETIKLGLEDLHEAAKGLRSYSNKENLRNQANDLNILISSVMTYQETCLDGFSSDPIDVMVRDIFSDGMMLVERLCSMALAVLKNMTANDMAKYATPKLVKEVVEETAAEVAGDSWPWWLSEKDKWLLQSPKTTPNVVVAADGSGDFTTVSEAVEAVPKKNDKTFVIKIKAGVYDEIVNVGSDKKKVMFVGEGTDKTIITGNRTMPTWKTFDTATVAVVGKGFMARDITFQNTAGRYANQSVALRVGSDRAAFYRCNFDSYQDTLYVHTKRHFFVKCHITGTVDFIFGYGATVLQDCDIEPRLGRDKQKNMITAHGRDDENENTGIVIQNCRIFASQDLLPVMDKFPTYLGRPWGVYARTVVMQSNISNVVHPEGWHQWSEEDAHRSDTVTYREYENRGEGAKTEKRVKWKGFKVITDPEEAEKYTAGGFIDGESWLPETGFPNELGLVNV